MATRVEDIGGLCDGVGEMEVRGGGRGGRAGGGETPDGVQGISLLVQGIIQTACRTRRCRQGGTNKVGPTRWYRQPGGTIKWYVRTLEVASMGRELGRVY